MGNFEFNKMPNNFFRFYHNPSYSADREVHDNLLTEAYNQLGAPCIYYSLTYDTKFDPLFGEDDNRRVKRKFPLISYYELPPELESYEKMGIEGLDIFQMHVSKLHFAEASKHGLSATIYPQTSGSETSAYPEIERPKPGDLLQTEYNNKFYEILDIGEEAEMFLQNKHTWTFTVRTFRDEHIILSASTSADMPEIDAIMDKEDILASDDYITSASEDVLYDPEIGEDSSEQDNLGSWFD